jgi:hypothetical protein
MAIAFTSGTLTITGTESIENLYTASTTNSWGVITRTGDGSLGTYYTILGFTNFDIGDGSTSTLFFANDIIVRISGLSRLRIRSNAVMRFGNVLNAIPTTPCNVYIHLGEDFFYTEGTGAYRQYGGLFYAQTRLGREGSAVQGSWEFQYVDQKLGDSITKSRLTIGAGYLHDSTGVAIKLSDPASTLPKATIANSTFAFQPLTEGTYTLTDLTLVNIIRDAIFNSVSASTLIFVNPSKLNFTFTGNAGNTAFVRFRFDLNVKNAGSNLQNVRVFVRDGQAGSAFNGLTAANGSITQQFLTYKRWNGADVSVVTDFSAHTVTVRRYGFVESTFPVVADRDNAFGLSATVYAFTTLSESAALAITGVTIDYGGKIITLSGAATLSSVHDFLYARACDSTGIQNEIPLVFSSATAAASNYSWVLPAAMTGSSALISLSAGRNVTLSTAGDYSGNKFGISATGVVSVVAGTTDLSGWTFTSGATITRVSGSAIVLVSPSQIANITPGTGVTIRQTPVTLTAPNLTSTAFDRVQCRVSLVPGGPINYNNSTGARVSGGNLFVSGDVNLSTNTITIAGVNGKITTNSPIRVGGTDLPVPLDPRAVYYPAGAYTSGNAIPLSGTPGGSTIDLIDTGTGDRWLEVWTELASPLITSGSLSVDLTGSASAAGVSLSNGDFIVLQAAHWKGNPQSQVPCTASEYFQQTFQYGGTALVTLAALESAELHNQICVIRSKDGSQVTEFLLDASAPGKIQLDTGVTEFSTFDAALFFYYARQRIEGLRLLRNNIQIIDLNNIKVVGELTIDAQVPAIGVGPHVYRADGKFITADESQRVDWRLSSAVGVPIRVEVPVDLSQGVMDMLAAIASAVAVPSAGGSFNPATDAVIVGSIQANAITASAIANNAITASSIGSNAITAAKLATNSITADALAADAVAEIRDGVNVPSIDVN